MAQFVLPHNMKEVLHGYGIFTREETTGKKAKIEHQSSQTGDSKVTVACVEKENKTLGYTPKVSLEEGIQKCFE
jgi:nucleoside-diphosphate-sugar epimerase